MRKVVQFTDSNQPPSNMFTLVMEGQYSDIIKCERKFVNMVVKNAHLGEIYEHLFVNCQSGFRERFNRSFEHILGPENLNNCESFKKQRSI